MHAPGLLGKIARRLLAKSPVIPNEYPEEGKVLYREAERPHLAAIPPHVAAGEGDAVKATTIRCAADEDAGDAGAAGLDNKTVLLPRLTAPPSRAAEGAVE